MSKYYYGNEVSEYGQEHNRVDYRTFAKAFDAVMCNNIMSELSAKGFYFEQVGGFVDNSDEIEELEEKAEELEELEELTEEQEKELEELREKIEELEEEQDEQPEIFQFFIVSGNAPAILEENNEIVFYNEDLDMYIWGVTHWGTSWDYVLTDIELEEVQ